MWRRVTLIVAIVFALGCSEETPSINTPPEHLYSPDLTDVGDKHREYANSFSSFDEFSSFVKRGAELTFYEGLPHQTWESDSRERELKSSAIKEFNNTPFYAEPISVPKTTAEQLAAIMSARSSFVPFSGYKLCGGFHADWCLVFKIGDLQYNTFLCFGCHELIVYHRDERILYCDIWDTKPLEMLLKPLQKHRPTVKLEE